MEDGSQLTLFLTILCILLAAWFAVAETAISAASRTRIRTVADRGDTRAKRALAVLDDFDSAVTTLLVCTNLAHITAATLVTVLVARRWGYTAVTLSTLVLTLVMFFLGEMLPKSLAKKHSEAFTLSVAGTLSLLMKLLRPVTRLLTAIGRAAAAHIQEEPDLSVTEDELYDIIEDMTEEGTLDEEQGDLISSALQFGDVTVESVLTPRVDVEAVDVEDSIEEILAQVRDQNHSRLPVYEGTIDNIIGVLQIRKFIKAYLHEGTALQIRPLIDPVLYVHQSTNIDELLPEMSRRKRNMAVVTDNYGGTLGIVTVEDILEELVGEIWDEDDVVEENITELGDGIYRIEADESVTDVFERIGFEDPEEDEELVNTLMGEWAYQQFTAIPGPGESFEYHGIHVTVEAVEHNRILNLRVEYHPETEEGGAEE